MQLEMMMSIIVAAYNVEQYIKRCLDSLVKQTMDSYEIIVVNDCSTDKTLDIVKSFADRYENIVIVDKKVNEGLSEARNSGLKAAQGKYVAFVDGDDYVENDTYQCCCELAEKTDADEIVFESFYEKNNGEQQYMPVSSSKIFYSTKEDMKLFFKEKIGAKPESSTDYQIGFAPWGRVYRLEILRNNDVNFISERQYIYEDLVFAMRVTPCIRKAAILNRAFYHYCENKNSLTMKIDVNRYYRVKTMNQYIQQMDIYKQYSSDCDFVERYHRTILGYIRLCLIQLCNSNEKKYMKKIVRDEMCKSVLKKYPICKLPVKQRIFAFLLKYHNVTLLYEIINIYINGRFV